MSPLLAFAWACFLVELTPGPNMTYLAVLTLEKGRRVGFGAVAGVALGLAIVGGLAAVGVGAIVSASPFLYNALRLAGVAYLLWLAYETWRGEETNYEEAAPEGDERAVRVAFFNGLITNLLNPKAAVFYITILPLFLDPARPPTVQALILAGIYVSVATAIHLVIVLMAARIRPIITSAGDSEIVRRVFAVLLVGVAVWMLVATQR